MAKKQIILIRHSYAEPSGAHGSDFTRALTSTGIKVLEQMKNSLKAVATPQICYVSSSLRTKATFEKINELWVLKNDCYRLEEQLYLGDISDYVAVIEATPNNVDTVAIIGHNPTISYLANKFNSGFVSGFSPASFLILSADFDEWTYAEKRWEIKEFFSASL